jgi:hypothetical protein
MSVSHDLILDIPREFRKQWHSVNTKFMVYFQLFCRLGEAFMQDFWSPFQKIIIDICSKFDKTWRKRKRVIDTNFLVLFIVKLVLSKNCQGYKSLLTELWENSELTSFQERPVSASSLCEARQKLPEEIFVELNKAILAYQKELLPLSDWCGHRIFAGDGSKINLPHELLGNSKLIISP